MAKLTCALCLLALGALSGCATMGDALCEFGNGMSGTQALCGTAYKIGHPECYTLTMQECMLKLTLEGHDVGPIPPSPTTVKDETVAVTPMPTTTNCHSDLMGGFRCTTNSGTKQSTTRCRKTVMGGFTCTDY